MKKVYLIGSLIETESKSLIDTVKEYNKAQIELGNKGINAVNITSYPLPEDEKQYTHLRITKLLSCDSVYLLSDWQNDKIAELEILTASFMGMEIVVANNALPPRKLLYVINH